MAQSYALMDGNRVVEIVTIADGSPGLAQRFDRRVVQRMRGITVEQAAMIRPGWLLVGGEFVAPDPPAPVPAYIPVPVVRERLELDGLWDDIAALLASQPSQMLKVVTLTDGVDPADPQVIGMLQAVGADPTRILAPPGVVLEPLPPPEPDPEP